MEYLKRHHRYAPGKSFHFYLSNQITIWVHQEKFFFPIVNCIPFNNEYVLRNKRSMPTREKRYFNVSVDAVNQRSVEFGDPRDVSM